MPIRAVAFDLDETLAVVARDREAILDDATAAVDAPGLTREAYLDAHGRDHAHETRAPIFAELLSGAGGDEAPGSAEADPAALASAYRERIAEALAPVPGAADLVADLRERYRVGLLTNGPARAQRDKLAELGWADRFDAVVVTGELGVGKPDERAFRAVCDRLDARPAETAYVGDQVEADVGGAAAAGLAVVQVCRDGGPAPDPRADAHVDRADLAERLPGVLADLDG